MTNKVDSPLSIPFFDSEEISNNQESELLRKILSNYLNWLPESIQSVIRTVLIVDSKLMGYELGVDNITNILSQKNTLSEELVQRLGEYLKIHESTKVNTHIFAVREKLGTMLNNPLDVQEDTNLTGESIIIKASGGWNRYFVFQEDPGIYLYNNTLTVVSSSSKDGWPTRTPPLSTEQQEAKVREILSPYMISLFSDRKKK